MPALPPLSESLTDHNSLSQSVSLLFEHSPILLSDLVLKLCSDVIDRAPSSRIASYDDLVDLCLREVNSWSDDLRSEFIAGHPRIGETKNLSALSAREQSQGEGASTATPSYAAHPEVLARLKHLNECYERKYPGLIYITFVNGRSRAVVAEEMKDALGIAPRSRSADDPPLETIVPVEVGGEDWKRELDRAIRDIGSIAKSRLRALGAV